jgi:signal transduction histidine kinase
VKVRTRLLLFGAALPVAGTLGAVLLAGELFHLSLVRALDRSLEELAAVESVSLFDGPNGHPHLPMTPEAPPPPVLPQGVVAVYAFGGGPLLRIPAQARVPDTAPSTETRGPFTTRALGDTPTRELATVVTGRDGQRFVLWLAAPLGGVLATTATFFQITLGVWAVMGLGLLVLQLRQARLLGQRVSAMAAYLPRLREGALGLPLEPDPTGDEIAALREALSEASRQLKAARDRQERLIANAAHEVQTPLACMRTLIDLALIRERSAGELREALKESRDEIDRLGALARNLMDLASAGQVSMEEREVDLFALCAASAEAFRAQASQKRLSLTVEAAADEEGGSPPTGPRPSFLVRGDRVALRQAIDNLVSNALKFAPADGRVEVRLAIALTDGDQRRRVQVIVSDDGPGVPAGDEEKIFEPFFRLRHDPGGAGLGLPLAREIARRLGGDVRVVARPPGSPGACFRLDLPPAPVA